MPKDISYEQTQLYKIRHTAAHVLAMAVLEFDPEAKLAIGPPIENGFYYDFKFTKTLSEDDLATLEESMANIVSKNLPVEHKTLKHDEAVDLYKKQHQPFKEELARDLKDSELGFYGIGLFWDLCKGPHVKSTGEIMAFKLLSLAGAYWRGDEKQPMLTRIYGTAFENKKDLENYLEQLEEAKKRDHKKLGRELDLFVFSDLVGSGLPLWTPKGTTLRLALDEFVWKLRSKYGYERVEIPHLAKKDLYVKSGHWEKFKEDLFRITTREGHEYALKPMNCPHHTQIFARKLWSYREMPQRYANTTMVYRDEQSGELSGLSRVLSITQDDAHVFCRADQVKEEMDNVWSIIEEFYSATGFKDLVPRLSFRDPATPEKYLGDVATWDQAEKQLSDLVKARGKKPLNGLGEATFYGPKIDFIAKDALGRSLQVATIQLDMNMPKRFDLTYVNQEGKAESVIMIHCAIMGSIERFVSVLIENFGGEFPFWLAPVQVKVLPVSEKSLAYATSLRDELTQAGLRVEMDQASETLGKRIRGAELEKVPYLAVVGEREAAEGSVNIRQRKSPDQKTLKIADFIAELQSQQR